MLFSPNCRSASCRSVLAVVAAVWCLPPSAHGQAPEAPEPDAICRLLMDTYILRVGKIETASIDAAIELISARGRNNGYWREVYSHFQKTDANNEGALLRIFTKMLVRDGHARWLAVHPDPHPSASPLGVVLPPGVLDTIMARARRAKGMQLSRYVVAVVAAHDTRRRDFLREILDSRAPADDLFVENRTPQPPPAANNTEAKFLAAVGLAELGDVAGVEWLVNSKEYGGFVWSAYHIEGQGGVLESRLKALADLTSEKFATIEEWQAWWNAKSSAEKAASSPLSRVRLKYP